MKTIRGKLIAYVFVFVVWFQGTAISVFVSSNKLMSAYHNGFQRSLLSSTISQQLDDLCMFSTSFVSEAVPRRSRQVSEHREQLMRVKERLAHAMADKENIELKNYLNILESFILEAELTVGFVLLDDIEQYTYHLEETRNAARYIQEATLELLDVELTAYQPFYHDLQKRNDFFLLFIIFLFLTTIMLAVFFALWFSKGITQPIHALSAAAQE